MEKKQEIGRVVSNWMYEGIQGEMWKGMERGYTRCHDGEMDAGHIIKCIQLQWRCRVCIFFGAFFEIPIWRRGGVLL